MKKAFASQNQSDEVRAVNSYREEEFGRSRAVTIPYGIRELADDESLEPQVVKIRSQNRDIIEFSGVFPVGTDFQTMGGHMINRGKRLALRRVRADICIPTFNQSYNTINIMVNSTPYTVTITCNQTIILNAFPNGSLAAAQVIAAAVTTQTGMTLTAASATTNVITWTGNQQWYFFLGGNINPSTLGFVDITQNQADNSVSQTTWITYSSGFSTNYIDISSRALTMDSKMGGSGNTSSNFLHRIYLANNRPHIIDYYLNEPCQWINVNQRHIDAIDIRLSPDLKVYQGYYLSPSIGGVNYPPPRQLVPHFVNLRLEFLVES